MKSDYKFPFTEEQVDEFLKEWMVSKNFVEWKDDLARVFEKATQEYQFLYHMHADSLKAYIVGVLPEPFATVSPHVRETVLIHASDVLAHELFQQMVSKYDRG